jgi:hypothetical protein
MESFKPQKSSFDMPAEFFSAKNFMASSSENR